MIVDEEVIKWLNKVRCEAKKVTRYDEVDSRTEEVDETSSVFVYDYYELNKKTGKEDHMSVIIIMYCGGYVDYFYKDVEDDGE